MTERLADINAKVEGIQEIGMVVNAIRGIAASRAQQARNQLRAVDSYNRTIASAIRRTVARRSASADDRKNRSDRSALLVFCAEQGFAGAFGEHVLDEISGELGNVELFLVGTRGIALARERGIVPDWTIAMSSHSSGIPKMAGHIAEALFAHIATGKINRMVAVFSQWKAGQEVQVVRRTLFPLDLEKFPEISQDNQELLNLPVETLLNKLIDDYIFAQICNMGLHAFAAENEARMAAMGSARRQVEKQLAALQERQHHARQEEITSEIIELSLGEAASRGIR